MKQAVRLAGISKSDKTALSSLNFHKLPHQLRNVVCLGIQRKVACVEHADLHARYILAVAFGLARIERSDAVESVSELFWIGPIAVPKARIVQSHQMVVVCKPCQQRLKQLCREPYRSCGRNQASGLVGPGMRSIDASASLINETIGTGWHKDLYGLKSLEPFAQDSGFLDRWRKTQEASKSRLAIHIKETMSIDVDPPSMFDVQVKRLHEYKRQILERTAHPFAVLPDKGRHDERPRASYVPLRRKSCTQLHDGEAHHQADMSGGGAGRQ
jgi:Carbohydrate phosphorylase